MEDLIKIAKLTMVLPNLPNFGGPEGEKSIKPDVLSGLSLVLSIYFDAWHMLG